LTTPLFRCDLTIIKLGRIHSNFDFERGGYNLKYGNLENGELENIFVSKIGKWQVQRNATGSSNLISKTAISKMVLGTKSYLQYKQVHRCLCLHLCLFLRLSHSRLNSSLPFFEKEKDSRYKFRELHFWHLKTPYSRLMTFLNFECQLWKSNLNMIHQILFNSSETSDYIRPGQRPAHGPNTARQAL